MTQVSLRRVAADSRRRAGSTCRRMLPFLFLLHLGLLLHLASRFRRPATVPPAMPRSDLPETVVGRPPPLTKAPPEPSLRAFLRPNESFSILEYPSVTWSAACSGSPGGVLPSLLPTDDPPCDRDPYLPWIHDLFPAPDGAGGSAVYIVAQNRRRCDTGPGNVEEMRAREPQLALFQSVSLRREGKKFVLTDVDGADEDARHTRFLCRFHGPRGESVVVPSRFPVPYEYVHYRKKFQHVFFEEAGKADRDNIWLSTLVFSCPAPAGFDFGEELYLDLIPIRLPARPRSYNVSRRTGRGDGRNTMGESDMWDPVAEHGRWTVDPRDPGLARWENLPVCGVHGPSEDEAAPRPDAARPFELTACTWAAASYQNRGQDDPLSAWSDGRRRLREWISLHLLVGFEHLYVYDNSRGAVNVPPDEGKEGQLTLKDVAEEFPSSRVTYIDWPAKVCNNNRNFDKNPAERSSQYAAEADCRWRYGRYTEWMGSFDVDEYIFPTNKKFKNMKEVLRDLDAMQAGTTPLEAVTFKSSRAMARVEFMEPFYNRWSCNHQVEYPCLAPRADPPYLQTFNCNSHQSWEKKQSEPRSFLRASKQIYRPAAVLARFVHYSVVKTRMVQTFHKNANRPWPRDWFLNPFGTETVASERFHAALLHTKDTKPKYTLNRARACGRIKSGPGECAVGFPWPGNMAKEEEGAEERPGNEEGFAYNCLGHPRLEEEWIPKLGEVMRGMEERRGGTREGSEGGRGRRLREMVPSSVLQNFTA